MSRRLRLGVIGAVLAASLALGAYFFTPENPEDRARRQAFERIYAEGLWATDQRGKGTSGGGSTIEATKFYRRFLQDFLAAYAIRSVVDAGCGDWEFSQAVDWSGVQYLGVDIVPAVIEANQRRFSKPNIRFAVADIVREDLPPADLLLVKDVLQHLSNADIARFARQFGRYRHVLLVNDVEPGSLTAEPKDIPSGRYRPIDPTRPPYALPGKKIFAWRDPDGNTKVVVHLQRPTD